MRLYSVRRALLRSSVEVLPIAYRGALAGQPSLGDKAAAWSFYTLIEELPGARVPIIRAFVGME